MGSDQAMTQYSLQTGGCLSGDDGDGACPATSEIQDSEPIPIDRHEERSLRPGYSTTILEVTVYTSAQYDFVVYSQYNLCRCIKLVNQDCRHGRKGTWKYKKR